MKQFNIALFISLAAGFIMFAFFSLVLALTAFCRQAKLDGVWLLIPFAVFLLLAASFFAAAMQLLE